jgi:hypothetical protein
MSGAISGDALAQDFRFAYPLPAPGSVVVHADIPFRAGSPPLRFDVYRGRSPSGARPALIFFNVGQRSQPFYSAWGRVAASQGIVAIVPDLSRDSAAKDLSALARHLIEHAGDHGIDPEAIAVYAGSGYVSTALPIVEDSASRWVKAAVMYYGAANVREFRRDLPVLYVRAGLDRPGVNVEIGELVARALSQNAPIMVFNHIMGHHAFEMVDDDAATRQVIETTIDFVKRATAAQYQASLRTGETEATAAAQVANGRYREAAQLYARLLSARADDAMLRLSYGEALLGDKQYVAACAEFGRLKGKGLGPRDLALPAAQACLGSGDAEAAVAWLKTIPKRFRPQRLQTDPAFAALRDRADFKALFQPE